MLTPGKIHAVQAEGDKESAEKPRFDIQAKTITLSIHGQICRFHWIMSWKSDKISSEHRVISKSIPGNFYYPMIFLDIDINYPFFPHLPGEGC